MGQVRIDPKSQNFPFLDRGKYGPGLENEATCEWVTLQVPAEEPPRYDPDNKRGPYAYVEIRVDRPDKRPITLREHIEIGENSGSPLLGWLTNVGIEVASDGTFDDSLVPGKKVGVECGEPSSSKQNPDRKYTRLRNVFGV